ncbi:MAG: DUF1801 domain-containing protein [Saprospiraceae bacterium]|nr:DUF1801 domain-containing protein [Saprospiraceae bacterium]
MKYQNLQFKSLDDLLNFLTEDQRILTERLREIIFETLPHVKEKLSYNVPFYFLNSRIAFIWPGAVPWGKTVKSGVDLGFPLGYLLPPNSYLQKGNRKEVHIKNILTEADINERIIIELLNQSAEIDEIKNRKY